MDFNIYDVYADASINLENKIGCAGIALVDRKKDLLIDEQYFVKEQATNNMCEIIALWLGVYRAIELLYTETLPFHVNIFSDSQISLFGMREWISTWVKNKRGQVLFNNGPIANQEWFADAYHAIICTGLKLKFFHQKGHVDARNPRSIFEADRSFRTANANSMHMIGTTPQILAKYNNLVDQNSRKIVVALTNGADITQMPNVRIVPYIPTMYRFVDGEVEQYLSLIRGGLNYPRNFNGGMM